MTIEHEGKTLTMQQAKKYLESPDRAERKIVYEKIRARRKADEEKLNNLLSELIQLRNQVARNAGYESFVEYQWDRRGRFDYTQDDVFSFHRGVKEHVVPIVTKINEQKKAKLGLDRLQPYDVEVDSSGEASLNPFTTGEELLTKATEVVGKVSPAFGKNIDIMKAHGRFDLDSRPGKAPGGYNYPMATSGYPFVFMNAAGTNQDVITFVHEAGHAMHCFCTEEQDIPLAVFRNEYPMEMAEVASMSMELMSMYHRDIFYTDPKDLKRAQQEEIERSIDILPWVSIIDSFQYWLYKNPDHTAEQRGEKFALLLEEYQPDIDWSDYRSYQHIRRQQQGHIFNTPFYYIDYGIAQLGAISVWQNYIQDAPKALEMYQK